MKLIELATVLAILDVDGDPEVCMINEHGQKVDIVDLGVEISPDGTYVALYSNKA